MPEYSYLIGNKYGRWTVIEKDEEASKKHQRPYYKCKCDCGTERSVSAKDLRNGKSTSCGCLRRERTSEAVFKDLTGQIFGRWKVLKIDWENTTPGYYFYICQCKCGVIKSVSAGNLRNGTSTSCGCYRSEVSTKTNKIYINEVEKYGVCFFNESGTGKYFIFDLEDLDIVQSHCWRISNGYASTNIREEDGLEHHRLFHRIIMERKYGNLDDNQIDHADHNTLDNRKDINLRICTRSQNQLNRTSKISEVSGERNVSYSSIRDNYAVSIPGTPVVYFKDKESAINYRDMYFEHHPDEFRYDPNRDVRNFNNINEDGSISPFFVVNCNKPIISPFIIVNEEKFNK